MNGPTFGRKMMLLGLVPAVVVGMILAFIFLAQLYRGLEESLEDNIRSFTMHLAPAAEYGVISNNESVLKLLTESSMGDKHVVSVQIVDDKGVVLVESGRQGMFSKPVRQQLKQRPVYLDRNNDMLFAVAPIYKTRVIISPEAGGDGNVRYMVTRNVLGYVYAGFTRKYTRDQQNAVMMKGAFVVLLVLLATMLIARRTAASLSTPITSLSEKVEVLRSGDYSARVELEGGREFHGLQQGFNELADALTVNHHEMQLKIETATKSLREAMVLLERKNESLINERENARLANQAKSQFLANMSHELRTPLNVMIGYTEMLMEKCGVNADGEVKADLEKIRSSGHHLLDIINDILDISKIEAGKMSLLPEEKALFDFVSDIEAMVKPLGLKNGNTLKVTNRISEDFVLFNDILKIRQIIYNLVSNACKFTNNGNVSVVFSMSEDRSGYLVIEVADDGIGISEKDQAGLFRPFVQVDNGSTREFEGTGLGLALSKKFADMIKGQIRVESTPGRGSVFALVIPVDIHDA